MEKRRNQTLSEHIFTAVKLYGFVFGSIFACVLSLCIGASLTSTVAHNRQLSEHERAFTHGVSHPPGTTLIRSHREVNNIMTPNDCTYFVGQLRSYEGNAQEITSFYDIENERVKVLFIEDGQFTADTLYQLPSDFNEVSEWLGTDSVAEDTNLYVVYDRSIGEGLFDIRCQ